MPLSNKVVKKRLSQEITNEINQKTGMENFTIKKNKSKIDEKYSSDKNDLYDDKVDSLGKLTNKKIDT